MGRVSFVNNKSKLGLSLAPYCLGKVYRLMARGGRRRLGLFTCDVTGVGGGGVIRERIVLSYRGISPGPELSL